MFNGILLIDKPAQMTSFGVVARVRRVLGERSRELLSGVTPDNPQSVTLEGKQLPKKIKVGHAGTLDPFATGLLVLLVGKYTKYAPFLLKLDKKYEATIRLGATSTTGDPEGEISNTFAGENPPTLNQIEAILPMFTGKIKQRVPKFSAVKIGGRRAYDLARKGKDVEMPVRDVEVYQLEVTQYQWPELKIACHVSSGTYIRTLGEDIGEALGVGGYLTALRRTQVGDLQIEQAQPLSEAMSHPETLRFLTLNPEKIRKKG